MALSMRRFFALARTAALETFAQPLTAVLFLSAACTVHLAGVFHFHQFGEPERLVRECGLSALLVFGVVFASAAAVRTVSRELSDGTGAMALSRDVPRAAFLCGKLAGVAAAYVLFAAAMLAATALAAETAVRGAQIALVDPAVRLWKPGVAAGTCGTLLAFAAAAAANRFFRFRFCLWACLLVALAQPLALCAVACDAALPRLTAYGAAFATLIAGCLAFVTMAGALAVRLPSGMTTAFVVIAGVSAFVCPVHFCVPSFAFFWAADRLANGAVYGWPDALPALGAGAALALAWFACGAALLERREIP